MQAVNNTLEVIRSLFEQKIKSQNIQINILQTKVIQLESRMAINEHVTYMTTRKLDDQEQFSRKINLRLRGIEVEENDSPKNLMQKIQDITKSLAVNVENSEYDRCHRVGRKHRIKGKIYQDILLKLCTWKSRDILYQNRKRFPFKMSADLTTRRANILQYADNQVRENELLYRNISFVFADQNCNLKICSKSKAFFTFNSKYEFLNIVTHLDNEGLSSSDLRADLEKGDNQVSLYY